MWTFKFYLWKSGFFQKYENTLVCCIVIRAVWCVCKLIVMKIQRKLIKCTKIFLRFQEKVSGGSRPLFRYHRERLRQMVRKRLSRAFFWSLALYCIQLFGPSKVRRVKIQLRIWPCHSISYFMNCHAWMNMPEGLHCAFWNMNCFKIKKIVLFQTTLENFGCSLKAGKSWRIVSNTATLLFVLCSY